MSVPPTASPTIIAKHLRQLYAERGLALAGAAADRELLADLDEEIADCRHAYVGAAVTEIAALRARLAGPLYG